MQIEEVLSLKWKELNAALLRCDDEAELECWLAATIASGKRTRSKRILGRLTTVRRAKALGELPPKRAVEHQYEKESVNMR